ncbi:MAG TPA: hypothetical protein VFA38_04405 [Nitrospirales bacterium]|nr:hypothetical protein [Nitrospirales bacterium]
MTYLFEHETLFVITVSALIAALLVLRIRLARRRRRGGRADTGSN